MSRPSDHYDSAPAPSASGIVQPKLGLTGWLRWFWRQLTSMRTALFLLLMLAIAAVPGSLVPQRSSDPNGVTQYFTDNPDLAPVLDRIQAFDVYSSAWFSSIYILLFVSLIGCVIPRTKHHYLALKAKPPATPARLARLAGFTVRTAPAGTDAAAAIGSARALLKSSGYRTALFDRAGSGRSDNTGEFSVAAERGYLRETGNLVFHSALVGILITVGFGGGFGFTGQRVLVEGQTFVNTLLAYDSFNPGRFFNDANLEPYKLTLDEFAVTYEEANRKAYGQPVDYTASVSVTPPGEKPTQSEVKVNGPLRTGGTDIFLLGNGYAPTITVTDPSGKAVFTDSVPFLPQDANLTSLGVVKVPDGLAEQVGMIGFFYPTQATTESGAFFSSFPDLAYPVLTLRVFTGDLGLDAGVPTSVYSLDTDNMTARTGGDTGSKSLELMPGQTVDLPNGLGAVTFDSSSPDAAEGDFSTSVPRFASFDVHHDPTQGWVLLFAILVLLGLLTSLFVPRRRVWVKAIEHEDGTLRLEYAGLARGDDPALEAAVTALADKHAAQFPPIPVVDPTPKSI
ncbi:cytochrome c biogenesis protein ResB [Cryobacterium psychrophilum]|uniref:Cytochrome c biogenesis protein ResB n=1 Tax=Cryobacterium psychrophilum TaxID=41988 RepID=A0A4Y8KP56_9MICO|nr:cytochrome c biogenesis protein ResB [Cryobacterium psychrophilum]TDW30389.1 cytochrome c biogenesis protein [Cryobacterium psychrophilum]TFD79111.1 cytochrome c biogenesis protein ResB [Cryobacterium psychrophilum]